MRSIGISKTDINRNRHLKLHGLPDHKINPPHQLSGPRKAILSCPSHLNHNKLALRRRPGIPSSASPAISGCDSRNRCAVSRAVHAGNDTDTLPRLLLFQSLIYLLLCIHLFQLLIPKCDNSGSAVFLSKIQVRIVNSRINHSDQDSFSEQRKTRVLYRINTGNSPSIFHFKKRESFTIQES